MKPGNEAREVAGMATVDASGPGCQFVAGNVTSCSGHWPLMALGLCVSMNMPPSLKSQAHYCILSFQ